MVSHGMRPFSFRAPRTDFASSASSSADTLEELEVAGRHDGAEHLTAALDDDGLALEGDALEDIGELRAPGSWREASSRTRCTKRSTRARRRARLS
jgi:hypothetical protein